jgi:sulfatase maturation enzyme AslB (radical SAM superfamily)
MESTSIENGYFVFTLMPSLYCHLRCPHCYLSIEEREDKTILSPDLIEATCRKIDAYWNERGIEKRTVVCYWYGGEPTSMGIDVFKDMADRINSVFSADRGYTVKHTVLTSLVSVRKDW